MSIAVRLANRIPTLPGPICGKAIDPAIVTNDWAPVFRFSRAAKRAFDVVAAIVGLVLFSPMLLLVAIAIKTDSRGPVFHPQTVRGYNNENIRVLKFRTTRLWGHGKVLQYVTRVGAVLRRTGIDGLPLLINVLRGEMSIVGPAPYVTALNSIFAEQVSLIQQRHRVKPGITGWAQVNGCCGDGDKMIRQRVEFDRYYIENWAFLFDIKIILMTLFSKNAYLN
jgi:lipopolysaccharide/colanic/teichoic acid biosynthesis glycosyltransferase